MKTSFADADQAAQVPDAPNAEPTAALVPQATNEIVPDSFFGNDQIEGDFDKSDLKIPRLSVVQSVGPLSGELGFVPGTIVYNKETVIGTPSKNPQGAINGTDGLILTLLHLKKYFLEDLPYGAEAMPQYFKTADDARRAGFLPIQDKRQMGAEHKYFKPVIDADVLIKGTPENVTFPFDFNGTPYAVARWTLQSTAYSRVGKQFATDATLALRQGLTSKFYTVSVKREKLGQNFVYVPKATLTGVNPPEFVEWIKNSVKL